MKYEWKYVGNSVEISMKYQWKFIENPVEISLKKTMKIHWKSS